MTDAASDPLALARRYLAQQADGAVEPWLLERYTRADAIEAVRRSRAARAAQSSIVPAGGAVRLAAPEAGTTARRAADAAGIGVVDAAAIEAAESLDALARLVESCTRCSLHETRTNAVFGEGDPNARVVCVGEAPGAREDATGRPFVGRAGQLLDRLLRTIGLPRESVYICNVLKSRPPNNRDPLPDEVASCSPYLLRQLALIRPEVIVAFGAFASRTLLDTKAALGRMRGRVHEYAGYPVVVTYHPAALLRNPGWTRATWEDLQIVRGLLDEASDG